MNKYFQRSDGFLAAAGLLGMAYFVLSYHKTYSEATPSQMIPREEVLKLSENFLKLPGMLIPDSLDRLNKRVELSSDSKQIRYLQELLGLEKGNQVIRSEVPAYFWRLRWLSVSDNNLHIGSDKEEKASDASEKNPDEQLSLQFDGAGRLIYYRCKTKELRNPSVKSPELESYHLTPSVPAPTPITPDSARKIALAFVQRLTRLNLDEFFEPELKNSTQNQVLHDQFSQIQTNEFSFTAKEKKYGETETFKISVQNASVTGFDFHFQIPSDYIAVKERPSGKVKDVTDVLSIIVISLVMIVFFFKRFRTGAIDTKLGVFFGIVAFITFGVTLFIQIGTDYWIITLLAIIFGGGFWMLTMAFAVAVSASVGHDVWPEKYQTFDAMRRGKFFNQKSGLSLVRGICWAGILLGVMVFVLKTLPQSSVIASSETEAIFGRLGAIYIIFSLTGHVFLHAHAVWLLMLSALRKKISKHWILYGIGILIGILAPYISGNAGPFWTRLVLGAALGGLTTYVLVRYDFLTLFVMMFIADLLQTGLPLIIGNDAYQSSILVIFMALVAITALIGTFSRESGEDILEYIPDYVKEIENKHRMQREFEIARHIQTTLLCRTAPASDVFELASYCEPAYEVGGDYYDFIAFPDSAHKKIGVVIGDVSGKGVSAAFYSTLVKGIVQTQAGITPASAKETLVRVNDIFYEHVQRGKFISMIYAIFDMEKMIVSLARAGHNPVLVKKSNENEPETLTPGGIAIGLTRGKSFVESLEEIQIPFKKNDVFVFYTDGFSEAMNKRNEEYGEDRLSETIQRHSSLSAPEIITEIKNDVARHAGATPQHDDMTMVVVKIKD